VRAAPRRLPTSRASPSTSLTRTAITPAGIDRLAELPALKAVFVNACDPATIARAKQIAHWTVGDSVQGFDDERDA
jgi:hypothetical protein